MAKALARSRRHDFADEVRLLQEGINLLERQLADLKAISPQEHQRLWCYNVKDPKGK